MEGQNKHYFHSWIKSLSCKLINSVISKKNKAEAIFKQDTKAFCLSPTHDDLEEKTELPLFLLRLPSHSKYPCYKTEHTIISQKSERQSSWLIDPFSSSN